MDKKINDFFHAPTMMFGDKADGKLTIVTALHLAAAFTNISGCGIYMVDYEKKEGVLHV